MTLSNAPKSWWGRNWKWVLGGWLGLGLLGGAVVLVSVNNSDAKKLAMAKASSNRLLIERLGEPIKSGWFITGIIERKTASGKAELAIPVSGPKGKGTLHALSVETADVWQLTSLQFAESGKSEQIDLLAR